MHEQLSFKKARWVISTVRSMEMNLALIHNLKREFYTGKVALTATDSQEAAKFEKAGVNLVFWLFKDATEQAADALTYDLGDTILKPQCILIHEDFTILQRRSRWVSFRPSTN